MVLISILEVLRIFCGSGDLEIGRHVGILLDVDQVS